MYHQFKLLRTNIRDKVAYVTIDNPPINLIDEPLLLELFKIGKLLSEDPNVRVIVFESANKEFFLAHIDVHLLERPMQVTEKPGSLTLFHQLTEMYRTMNKATIGKIAGRARGAGSEFLQALDMRFGAVESAILGQPEIAVGFPPGGGALQRLARLTGRGRALEIMLSGLDYDARTAEQYGWINRAMPLTELDSFVDSLAGRIATYPSQAIGLLKTAFNVIEETTTVDGLLEDSYYFGQALRTVEAQHRVRRFLDLGGQTLEVELNLTDIFDRLAMEK